MNLPIPAFVKGCQDYYSAEQLKHYGYQMWQQALGEADIIHKGLLNTWAESEILNRTKDKERIEELEEALREVVKQYENVRAAEGYPTAQSESTKRAKELLDSSKNT